MKNLYKHFLRNFLRIGTDQVFVNEYKKMEFLILRRSIKKLIGQIFRRMKEL